MENRLFAHYERLGTAVTPLVETAEAEFWDAARAQLTSEQSVTVDAKREFDRRFDGQR